MRSASTRTMPPRWVPGGRGAGLAARCRQRRRRRAARAARRRTQLAFRRRARRQGGQEPHPPRLPARRSAGRGRPRDRLGCAATSTSVRATRAGSCWPIPEGNEFCILAAERLISVPAATVRVCTATRRLAMCILRTLVALAVTVVVGADLSAGAPRRCPKRPYPPPRRPMPAPGPLTIGPAATDTLRRVDSRWPDAEPVRRVESDCRLNSIRRCSTPFRTLPAGGRRRRHRHADHVGLALEGFPAAAVR